MKNICQTIKPFLFLLVEATDNKRFMDKKKNILNNLKDTKKENSFSVPEGYFNNFQQRLQEKIREEQEIMIPVKHAWHVHRLVWASGIAAVFLIAFFISRNIIGVGADSPLSQDEIVLAFEEEMLDMDELFLLENIEEMTREEVPGNGYSEEIITYLLDEDIEIDKIVNEL